ncbi:craniofacial development protein 2-like [Nilaparvata lugens]|uniref:craniofacial development protein 2-like n=1 Tax=Nilaparvata lugens TaxID=108931 RepID=UPI00193E6086|nr:craniofacial development protein 2-like [Nilaparvata lugens]
MRKYRVQLMGLSETKRKGQGQVQLDGGYCLRYSGVDKTRRAGEGVGVVVSGEMEGKVTGWKAVSSRIMYVDLEMEETVTVIQVYAPTEDYDIADKEAFYEELQKEMDKARDRSRHVIIMGDWNGRIGSEVNRGQGCMGRFAGDRILNDNGERIIDFCLENNLMIGNTFYNHKKIHQITYSALGRQAESVIDYMVYTRNTNYAVCDVKVIRGAELATDHKLLVLDTNFSIPKARKTKAYVKVKVEELRKPGVRDEFSRKMEEELTWQNEELERKGIEDIWNALKTTIKRVAEQACGSRQIKGQGKKRTKWWNDEVKIMVRYKKEAWKRYLQTRTEEDRRAYVEKRNQVKETVRRAKAETWPQNI